MKRKIILTISFFSYIYAADNLNTNNINLEFNSLKYHFINQNVNFSNISFYRNFDKLNLGVRLGFVNDIKLKNHAGGFFTLSFFARKNWNLNSFLNPYIEAEFGGGGGASQPSGRGTFYTYSIGNKIFYKKNLYFNLAYTKGKFFAKSNYHYYNSFEHIYINKNPDININSIRIGIGYSFDSENYKKYKVKFIPIISFVKYRKGSFTNSSSKEYKGKMIGAKILFPLTNLTNYYISYNIKAILGIGSGYMENSVSLLKMFNVNFVNNLKYFLEMGIGAGGGGTPMTTVSSGALYTMETGLMYKHLYISYVHEKSFRNKFGYNGINMSLYSSNKNIFQMFKNIHLYIRYNNHYNNKTKKLEHLFYIGLDKYIPLRKYEYKNITPFYGFSANFNLYQINKPNGIGGYADGFFNTGIKYKNIRLGFEGGAAAGGNIATKNINNIKYGPFLALDFKNNLYIKFEYLKLYKNTLTPFISIGLKYF